MNGMPQAVLDHPEAMKLFLPILGADIALCERHVFTRGAPLECPVTALGGTEDCDVPEEDLAGWREHTMGAFALRRFPGDHFYLSTAAPQLWSSIRTTNIKRRVTTAHHCSGAEWRPAHVRTIGWVEAKVFGGLGTGVDHVCPTFRSDPQLLLT